MQQLKIKTDLTKEAFDAIREAILSGKLPPGTPVGQEEMADRLGVSRQPVSRALVLLKREGLVVDRGRKGQMVAPIDADRLVALFQVRGSLDRLAARLVAANRDAATIAADRLGALIVTGRDAAARQDFAALVDADVVFHRTLYELAGNPEIAAAADVAWPHMVRSMHAVLSDVARHAMTWNEHEAIAKAVISGDIERAGELATHHTETAGEATYRRLKNFAGAPDSGDAKQDINRRMIQCA
tara:strand:- start:11942 stop:12667 length:726 start_codon:yes stop_codon:yes gene_type:complete